MQNPILQILDFGIRTLISQQPLQYGLYYLLKYFGELQAENPHKNVITKIMLMTCHAFLLIKLTMELFRLMPWAY